MYTIGVKFNTSSKIYHFASAMWFGKGEKTYVSPVHCGAGRRDVSVVFCREGIDDMCNKWRTGADVTKKQRKEYPLKEERGLARELHEAVSEFLRVRECIGLGIGVHSIDGEVRYFDSSGKFHSRENTFENALEIVEHAKVNQAKSKLQKQLQELLDKADEIKQEINKL